MRSERSESIPAEHQKYLRRFLSEKFLNGLLTISPGPRLKEVPNISTDAEFTHFPPLAVAL
jgi:hypothetical protein